MIFAFKSRSATLAFAAALFFAATLTAPPPAYAADPLAIPKVHFHAVNVMAPMIHDFLDRTIGQGG